MAQSIVGKQMNRWQGAEVKIVGIEKSAITDETGSFSFNDIPKGEYTLSITFAGTEIEEKISIVVQEGKNLTPTIYIDAVAYDLKGVEIKTKREAKPVIKRSLQAQEITRIPGTAEMHCVRYLQFPGIGVANDFSGALYIRGGSDEDNLYYFDRVPVGYPYHFGGLVSSLSSKSLIELMSTRVVMVLNLV